MQASYPDRWSGRGHELLGTAILGQAAPDWIARLAFIGLSSRRVYHETRRVSKIDSAAKWTAPNLVDSQKWLCYTQAEERERTS